MPVTTIHRGAPRSYGLSSFSSLHRLAPWFTFLAFIGNRYAVTVALPSERARWERLTMAPVRLREQGSFDCVSASLREALTSLRMTNLEHDALRMEIVS